MGSKINKKELNPMVVFKSIWNPIFIAIFLLNFQAKRHHDAARPFTAIRQLYGNHTVIKGKDVNTG